jgi:hypothetical protein
MGFAKVIQDLVDGGGLGDGRSRHPASLQSSAIRRVLHDGQMPRPLQLEAIRKSCPHSSRRARAKPYANPSLSRALIKSEIMPANLWPDNCLWPFFFNELDFQKL